MEYQIVQDFFRLIEVKERTGRDESRRAETDVIVAQPFQLEKKNNVQPVRLHIVLVAVVDELREHLTKCMICFLLTHVQTISRITNL